MLFPVFFFFCSQITNIKVLPFFAIVSASKGLAECRKWGENALNFKAARMAANLSRTQKQFRQLRRLF